MGIDRIRVGTPLAGKSGKTPAKDFSKKMLQAVRDVIFFNQFSPVS